MAVFVDRKTRLVVQGITGRDGSFHAVQMKKYGTNVVAGVTPGKAGTKVAGIPVFNNVFDTVEKTRANTSVIYVPPAFAADSIYEAVDAGIKTIVCITEGIPANDMMKVYHYTTHRGVRLIGPNSPGIISPELSKVGIIPGNICKRGNIGVVSRSGTLTYEVIFALTQAGMGQSTCMGIGGDQVIGTNFIDALEAFENDRSTKGIVMIGEIGGSDEEEAAAHVEKHMTKPVVGFIAGRTAPPGKRMGHAGAIISGSSGTAADKIAALNRVGIPVATSPLEVPELMAEKLKEMRPRKWEVRKMAARKTSGKATATKRAGKATVRKTARKSTAGKSGGKTIAEKKKRR
jgi:succinyl-CoA synthetase alpha subunit